MSRFTIRELLILTVTAGLAVGWWLDCDSPGLSDTGGAVDYDYELVA